MSLYLLQCTSINNNNDNIGGGSKTANIDISGKGKNSISNKSRKQKLTWGLIKRKFDIAKQIIALKQCFLLGIHCPKKCDTCNNKNDVGGNNNNNDNDGGSNNSIDKNSYKGGEGSNNNQHHKNNGSGNNKHDNNGIIDYGAGSVKCERCKSSNRKQSITIKVDYTGSKSKNDQIPEY